MNNKAKPTPRKTEVLSNSFDDAPCECDPHKVQEVVESMRVDLNELNKMLGGTNNVKALRTILSLQEQVQQLSETVNE